MSDYRMHVIGTKYPEEVIDYSCGGSDGGSPSRIASIWCNLNHHLPVLKDIKWPIIIDIYSGQTLLHTVEVERVMYPDFDGKALNSSYSVEVLQSVTNANKLKWTEVPNTFKSFGEAHNWCLDSHNKYHGIRIRLPNGKVKKLT